jgi:Na+/proline symporter
LAYKLDLLATWLFIAAVVVLCCGVIAAVLALSTTVDTFGIVSPQTESQSRLAVAAALFGGGLAGAGIVAGLAGILKSLVRRRDF